jgi:hypothetical protein
MYVIVRRRGAITMWLVSQLPQRWGERDQAVQFRSLGDARRAAVAVKLSGPIKLSGDWSIEALEN